jgi:hypothetical protein
MSDDATAKASRGETIYDRVAALLSRQNSPIVFRALTRWGSFDEYEGLLGIASPNHDFRRRLAVEIARYIDGAWIEAMPPTGDLEQKVKIARHKLKIIKNRLTRAKAPMIGNPDYKKAFVEHVYYQQELNIYKRPRGAVRKDSSANFAQRTAEIYTSVTGKEATIINNRDSDNGGLFGELLKKLTRDTLRLANALKVDPSRLSGNLARYARHRRQAP